MTAQIFNLRQKDNSIYKPILDIKRGNINPSKMIYTNP